LRVFWGNLKKLSHKATPNSNDDARRIRTNYAQLLFMFIPLWVYL